MTFNQMNNDYKTWMFWHHEVCFMLTVLFDLYQLGLCNIFINESLVRLMPKTLLTFCIGINGDQ